MNARRWRVLRRASLAIAIALSMSGVGLGQIVSPILSPPPPRTANTNSSAGAPPRLPAPARPAPPPLAPVATQPLRPPVEEADSSRLPQGAEAPRSPVDAPRAPVDVTRSPASGLRVSKGTGVLPNDHGQVWREYDISSYTEAAPDDAASPEQTIVDWILRETGTETWFSEPLGILSASRTTLRVYHTPEMQDTVRGIVERFVSAGASTQAIGLRLMTIGSPAWRTRAVSLLKPVEVKSPGVEAWLLSRENAAILLEQLKSRGDFREHGAPQVEIASGQAKTLARQETKRYMRGVQLKREYPFYDLIPGQLDEGYALEISPLASLDRQSIDAAIECRIDQVEKMVPLSIDVPIGSTQSQRVQVEVPQVVSWRLTERFRWPTSEVLLLSCGVVANPAGAGDALSFLSPLGLGNSGRADALLMIECHELKDGLARAPNIPMSVK